MQRPSLIVAEDFDHGGEGIAYHKTRKAEENTGYRLSDIKIIPAEDEPGGYNVGAQGGFCVTGMQERDWLKYTINVETAGIYEIGVRAASKGAGGIFHLETEGCDITGKLAVPDTGGWKAWKTIDCGKVNLHGGKQVLQLVMDKNAASGFVGNINYIEFNLIH